jgi:hypothetical protein
MKYLKTYENIIDWEFHNTWKDKFIDWFEENGIKKVKLPGKDSMNSIHYYPNENQYYNIMNIECKNDEIWITAEWGIGLKVGKDSWKTGFWNDDTLEEIWNYLQKLTPQEIENIKIKEEADKFNI